MLPAATARALLAGFRALGLDDTALRDVAGATSPTLEALDGVFPQDVFQRLWDAASARRPTPELPTEVGLAIPFGAFGALDYLAASSATVARGCETLAAHFRQVARHFALEVAPTEVGGGVVRIVWAQPSAPFRAVSDEFTLATFVGRFAAALAPEPLQGVALRLTRPRPDGPTRHDALLGGTVTFGCSEAALELGPATWQHRLSSADPRLQEMLAQLAARLELGPSTDGLELAVRARLRDLLPDGRAVAAEVARSLGLSERTLQRRLEAAGTSFSRVLDGFRRAEAERLLGQSVPLAEVALRLGFSDQTAWNRAFRRWTGTSPRAWRR